MFALNSIYVQLLKRKTPLLSGLLNRCGKDRIYINITENKIRSHSILRRAL